MAAVAELKTLADDPAGIALLRKAFDDESDSVVDAAVRVLGGVPSTETFAALSDLLRAVLASRSIQGSKRNYNDVLVSLVRVLRGFGPPAEPRLIDVLDNRDAEMMTDGSGVSVRPAVSAAVALTRVKSRKVAAALERRLNDGDAEMRAVSAEVLGQVGSADSALQLCKLLRDRDERVCAVAAEALGRLGDARSIESLVPLLADARPAVVSAAFHALAALSWKPDSRCDRIQLAVQVGNFDEASREGPAAIRPILRAIWLLYGIEHFTNPDDALARQLSNVLEHLSFAHLPSRERVEPAVEALRQLRGSLEIAEQDAAMIDDVPSLPVRGIGRFERYHPGSDLYFEEEEPYRTTIRV